MVIKGPVAKVSLFAGAIFNTVSAQTTIRDSV